MSELILLFILILANAYFAAAEIAFISLNDAKLDMQVKEGNKKAKSIKKILDNPSKFLATIQIGITFAGFLSSAFASEAFASELAPILHGWIPYLSLEVWNSISIVLITIVLSYFTLILGELVPKRIAMKYYEKIAFGTVGVIRTIATFTAPFVKLLTFSTNLVSKLFGVSETEEETVTEEEIRMLVDVGEEKGIIEKEEREMINNVFEFNDTVVSEIMVPRTEIYAVDMNLSISKVIEDITKDDEFRYSRIPVYDETIDEIKGVVYIKDILLSTKNKNVKIKNLVKEAYFVSETKPVNELFEELRKNRLQIAIVVDEYGGTAGVVTIEDILEEIVGEIYDEFDKIETPEIVRINENTLSVSSKASIDDINEQFDQDIPNEDFQTIGGYVFGLLGREPELNDVVEDKNITYTILELDGIKIQRIKMEKNTPFVDKKDVDKTEVSEE